MLFIFFIFVSCRSGDGLSNKMEVPIPLRSTPGLIPSFRRAYMIINAQPMSSTPLRITPTTAPVWTASPAPPATLCSIFASPSSHEIMTSGLTSNLTISSDSAVMMSAKARPSATFSVLMVERHEVTSVVLRRVSRIFLIASGRGAAIHW